MTDDTEHPFIKATLAKFDAMELHIKRLIKIYRPDLEEDEKETS